MCARHPLDVRSLTATTPYLAHQITTAGAKRLAEVFGREDSALSWLNINGNTEMGEDGVTALLTAFGNHKCV